MYIVLTAKECIPKYTRLLLTNTHQIKAKDAHSRKGYWKNNNGVNYFVLHLVFKPTACISKVKKILKGSLDLIPSPSPSVKIQIMGRKVCLRCKGKMLLGVINKHLKTKSLFTFSSNVLPLYLNQTFLSVIWIFTEGEGDGIKSRLSS